MSFLGYDKSELKHQTGQSYGSAVGIDLFDDEWTDENGPQCSVYERYADGTRSFARSVTMQAGHFETVLQAWARRGEVHDYRTVTHGQGVSGVDMRGSEQVAA